MNQPVHRDPVRVCNFGPFQSLYEKARELINETCNHPSHEAPAALALKLVALHDIVKDIEEFAAESDSLDHVREIAAELYEDSSCDIEIEPTCTYHNETDGYWVMGWLWVPDSKVAEEAEDEEDDLQAEEG